MLDLVQRDFFLRMRRKDYSEQISTVFQLCTHGQIHYILLKLFFYSYYSEKHNNKKINLYDITAIFMQINEWSQA